MYCSAYSCSGIYSKFLELVLFTFLCWVLKIYSFYQVVLDSDAGLFGGFGRIHHTAEHFTSVSLFARTCGCFYYTCVISFLANLK
uniref:Uncharacterized protein n=1 Tax=Aegilops tauschii subsp. strangulata TaxID=200361 RepID=A0A453C1R7_AEGTS